jgi:hypothetical protein
MSVPAALTLVRCYRALRLTICLALASSVLVLELLDHAIFAIRMNPVGAYYIRSMQSRHTTNGSAPGMLVFLSSFPLSFFVFALKKLFMNIC